MPEPVKLSRERWEMLVRGTGAKPRYFGHGDPVPCEVIELKTAREIDGIVFLPAEYVPYEPPCTCLTIPMVRA